MATYFVGDLQGCYDEFQLLLSKVNFDSSQDKLYLVGDLVARGDKSLDCLRFIKSLGKQAQTVLGNHDLHLLSTAMGLKKIKPRDHIDAIFNAPDCADLVDWLRQQPLLIYLPEKNILMSHAGISPDWDLRTTLACAKEVEAVLRSANFTTLLENMYSEQPDHWSSNLTCWARLRYIINVFTRMRYCYSDHRLEFKCKLPIEQAPHHLIPWFELTNPLYQEKNILFGHWASLVGYSMPQNIYALDTGCVWGRHLTILRWEDKQLFTQPALKKYQ